MSKALDFHSSDDATHYRANASFVNSDEYTRPVLALLDPHPGETIVDLGCGTGELTTRLARLVCQPDPTTGKTGRVLGLDAAQTMLDSFASSLEGEPGPEGLSIERVDGHDLEAWAGKRGVEGTFDKVFSNAALHWMRKDPSAVVSGVHALLKPDGIFAAEMGGHLNMVGVRGSLHAALRRRGLDADAADPWTFPTPSAYRALLEKAGFEVPSIELVPRITPLPTGGIEGWLRNFGGSFFSALADEEERNEVLEEVIDELRPDLYDEATATWTVMYVRLRFKAIKK